MRLGEKSFLIAVIVTVTTTIFLLKNHWFYILLATVTVKQIEIINKNYLVHPYIIKTTIKMDIITMLII